MSELKLVTRNIRINGIQHKASDMSEEEIKCLLIQRQDIILLNMNYDRRPGKKRRIIMEQITNYVKPELIVVAIALYFVGMALKQAQAVKDKYIPLILGGISIAICAIYVFATCTCGTGQDIAMAIFTAITQGILIAGLSTYVNQIVKQANKDE